jgi:Zn-dependent peptidase ImmA (M78 family)
VNIRRRHIRSLARQKIEEAGITNAPIDVKRIALLQNAAVHEEVADDKFAGYLLRDSPSGVAIIGVNAFHSETRRRFTIAHEIGHLLLHAPLEGEPVHFDEIFMRRDALSAQGTEPREKEANLFAAELLMPAHLIARDLPALTRSAASEERVIDELAEHYAVSVHAMGIRLSYLGYIENW